MSKLRLVQNEAEFSEVSIDGVKVPGSDVGKDSPFHGYIRIGGTSGFPAGADAAGDLGNAACSVYTKIVVNADPPVWERIEAARRRGAKFRITVEEV